MLFVDELKLKFYELDGFKKAHEGKLSSASESDMKRALMQVEKANKKNTALQQKLNELQEKNLHLTNENEKLNSEQKKNGTPRGNKASEDTIKMLKSRNDELVAKVNEMTQESSAVAQKLALMSEEKGKIERENDDLKSNFNKKLQEALKEVQDENAKLKNEFEQMKKLVSSDGDQNKALLEQINVLKASKLISFQSKLSAPAASTFSAVPHVSPNVTTQFPDNDIVEIGGNPEILETNDISKIRAEYLQQVSKIHELKETITSLNYKLNQFTNNNHNILVAARTRPPTEQEILQGTLVIENYSYNGLVNLFDPKLNKWNAFELDYHWPYDVQQKSVSSDVEFLFSHIVPSPFELYDSHYPKEIIKHSAILCYGEESSGKTYTAFGKDSNLGIAFQSLEKLFSQLNSYKNKLKNELLLEYKHYNIPADLIYDYSVFLSLYEVVEEKVFNGMDEGKGMKRFDLAKKVIYDPKLNQITIDGLMRGQVSDYNEAKSVLINSLHALQTMEGYEKRQDKTNTILEICVSIRYLPGQQPIRSKLLIVDLAANKLNITENDHSVNAFNDLFESFNNKLSNNNNINPPMGSPKLASPSKDNNDPSKLPYDGSKLTKILQPLFHPLSKQLLIFHLTPTDASYEMIKRELQLAESIRKSMTNAANSSLSITSNLLPPPPPSPSNAPSSPNLSQSYKGIKELEKQLFHITSELRETKRKNEIAEKGLNETRGLAEELVRQLNEGNRLLSQRYAEEKDLAKQLKHDLALTQRNLKKAIGETQEQRKINERLVKLVKGLEDERNSLNALVGEN